MCVCGVCVRACVRAACVRRACVRACVRSRSRVPISGKLSMVINEWLHLISPINSTVVMLFSTIVFRASSSHSRLKSPASRLFTQSFIQTQMKENIKAPRHWPLCGEFTGPGEFPAQRSSYAENVSIWCRHHDPQWNTWCIRSVLPFLILSFIHSLHVFVFLLLLGRGGIFYPGTCLHSLLSLVSFLFLPLWY